MTQIAIVVYPGFTALDFIGPYEVLRNLPDAEVRFVWHEPGPIAADSGVLLVGATHSFDETPSPDILLVPGGMSTFEHARDEKLLNWQSAPKARLAHPREDHLMPLLVAAGAAGSDRGSVLFADTVMKIPMTSYVFGEIKVKIE